MQINCIAAMDVKRGIGKDNTLPWHLPSEMKYFTRVTTKCEDQDKQNAVIMGRNTWESIPQKHRPLRNRLNIVLSRTTTQNNYPDSVIIAGSLEEALQSSERYCVESCFVIGGASVYNAAIAGGYCHNIYLTKVNGNFYCDTFFPQFDESLFKEKHGDQKIELENGISYTYHVYSYTKENRPEE